MHASVSADPCREYHRHRVRPASVDDDIRAVVLVFIFFFFLAVWIDELLCMFRSRESDVRVLFRLFRLPGDARLLGGPLNRGLLVALTDKGPRRLLFKCLLLKRLGLAR